jgi:hypothetical protein
MRLSDAVEVHDLAVEIVQQKHYLRAGSIVSIDLNATLTHQKSPAGLRDTHNAHFGWFRRSLRLLGTNPAFGHEFLMFPITLIIQ